MLQRLRRAIGFWDSPSGLCLDLSPRLLTRVCFVECRNRAPAFDKLKRSESSSTKVDLMPEHASDDPQSKGDPRTLCVAAGTMV